MNTSVYWSWTCPKPEAALLVGLSLYAFSERVGDLSKPRPGEEWRLAGPQECAFNPHTTLLCLTCYCCAKSLQSCMTLCDAMDHSPLGSSVHGILQASILEWVAMTSSRGSSPPRDRTHSSCMDRWIPYHWALGKPIALSASTPKGSDPHRGHHWPLWRWAGPCVEFRSHAPVCPLSFHLFIGKLRLLLFFFLSYSWAFTSHLASWRGLKRPLVGGWRHKFVFPSLFPSFFFDPGCFFPNGKVQRLI